MAYPFLKAKDISIGNSLCQEEDISLAKSILNSKNAEKIVLPLDHVLSDSPKGNPTNSDGQEISAGMMGLDIGEATRNSYSQILSSAKTVLWNGPMGLFEVENFSKGTLEVANALASNTSCFSLVGGGDSVSAVNKSGVSDKMGHISTGGGASLEYIEQGSLPGIQALKHGVS